MPNNLHEESLFLRLYDRANLFHNCAKLKKHSGARKKGASMMQRFNVILIRTHVVSLNAFQRDDMQTKSLVSLVANDYPSDHSPVHQLERNHR